MGAILTRTALASQAVVLLLCLLGLIGQSLSGFITSEDLWEIQESHLRAMQLGVDDSPHGDIRAPISVKEIAQKISGRPAVEGAKHVVPETAYGIRRELTDQVAEPFKQSLRGIAFGSIEQTEELRQNLVGRNYKRLENLIELIPLDTNKPSYLQEGMEEKAFRIQKYEETVSKFFRETKIILDILQVPHLVTLSNIDSHPISLTTALHNINDISVRLLVISEKHQLLSERGIQNLMKNEKMHQFIFNYILRRFRIRSDITSVYLNSDLKLSLEESPFTEELRGILKSFQAANWRKLERLFVGAQIKSFENGFGQISIQKEFLKVTSSSMLKRAGTPYFDKKVMSFMKDLIHLTSAIPVKDAINAKTGTNILKLKLLHNMLRIMNRYIVGQASKKIQRKLKYLTHNPKSTSNLQAFDESMILFSDVLKSVYVKYGETLQELPEDLKSDPDFKKKVEEKIYLTDSNKSNQASMFSTASTSANQDEIKLDHSESDQFIGVNHPQYRFQHLFEHGESSDSLPMDGKLFRTKLKGELKVEGLKGIIQPILERLQKIDTSSEASLYTKFDQLGHILSRPNSELIYRERLSYQ
ncbi:hypothetical protein PGT21_035073 [Puccinia graminis f. sp. tritici]|uniref:Uncharacterized protein n=1 Tax=Puccinia graminis f. sp. tritici TaxID=56615 RepID=A0A5B0NFR7_PUCGR|nr:hypothetical protein PGT21_035073 [Puccinia graminis f. sp. tritici]